MNCERANALISASAIITACDLSRDGALRLQTTFEYPGNEFVDLFVLNPTELDPHVMLTDGGQTVSQLLGFGLKMDGTKRRRQFVEDVCHQLGVYRRGGEFTVTIPDPIEANFGLMAVRLAQACVRIADLIITHQSRLTSTFTEQIEEGLEAIHIPVEPSVPLMGSKGREIKVDFVLRTSRLPTAIYGLSASSPGSAKRNVNATFRKWYELTPQKEAYQFVTLLDSTSSFWVDADRGLLEDVSEVFDYPAEVDAFRELVTSD